MNNIKEERIDKEYPIIEMQKDIARIQDELAKETRNYFIQLGSAGILFLSFIVPFIYNRFHINKYVFLYTVFSIILSTTFSFLLVKYALDKSTNNLIKNTHLFSKAFDIIELINNNHQTSTEDNNKVLSEIKDKNNKISELEEKRSFQLIFTFQNLILFLLFSGIIIFLINLSYAVYCEKY